MTINYTTEPIQPQRTYPWVGRYDTESKYTTVLFLEPKHGFCLDSTDTNNMEYRESHNWDEHKFIPCSITLSSL
jgi:hypothetical protein